MTNWLDKIAPRQRASPKRGTLVVKSGAAPGPVQLPSRRAAPAVRGARLPNATIIYAIAASALFVIALFFLFSGHWFTGLLVMLPGLCFLGYALHFMKHAD